MSKLFFLIGIFLASAMCAQSKKNAYDDIVKELCPSADTFEVEVKSDYVEIEFWCDGVLVEAGIDQNNKVIFKESKAEIPANVMRIIQNKLDKKYNDWVIDEYSFVQLPDTSFYKFELIKEGVEENVYFATDGKYYKTKSAGNSEKWDLKSLANTEPYKKAPYDFLKPRKTYELPEILKEISGITWAGDNIIYCVQDETGIIFKYDVNKEELSGMIRFTDIGDFEDIALFGDTAYILRSDGTLFSFNHVNFSGKFDQTVVPLNCLNIEGLCLDRSKRRFLISCKDPSINSNNLYRSIYSFSPQMKQSSQIALTIDVNEINKMLHKNFPKLSGIKVQFNPSAIAIHPLNNDLYILSANNRLLAIFRNNKLAEVYPLPAELYFKPEGLSFTENGNLYISSEGMKKGDLEGQIFYFE